MRPALALRVRVLIIPKGSLNGATNPKNGDDNRNKSTDIRSKGTVNRFNGTDFPVNAQVVRDPLLLKNGQVVFISHLPPPLSRAAEYEDSICVNCGRLQQEEQVSTRVGTDRPCMCCAALRCSMRAREQPRKRGNALNTFELVCAAHADELHGPSGLSRGAAHMAVP